jgi:hypothetical protein
MTGDGAPGAEGGATGDSVEQRAQVGVQCPKCQWRQFMEIEVDKQLLESPLAREIQAHLEEWLLSHCPDHLGELLKSSRN